MDGLCAPRAHSGPSAHITARRPLCSRHARAPPPLATRARREAQDIDVAPPRGALSVAPRSPAVVVMHPSLTASALSAGM